MDESSQIEEFLAGIDYGLLKYREEFLSHAVTSETTLKFLKPNEVREMKIPKVYQRLLISKIIELQTPDSKMKLKRDAESPIPGQSEQRSTGPTNRKRLFELFDSESETPPETSRSIVDVNANQLQLASSSSDVMEKQISKLSEERDEIQAVIQCKKEDLNVLKSKPVQPRSLPIPGHPVINVICDTCHHKGHRANGNRGGTSCPYVKCPGFYYCGIDNKHKEHKLQVSEKEKEIQSMDKQIKTLNSEIESIKNFQKYNNTSFITAVRPKVLAAFSGTSNYKGKDGTQNLNRDLRYIKIATGGKIPTSFTKANLESLVMKGKTKVSAVCEPFDGDDSTPVQTVSSSPIPCYQTQMPMGNFYPNWPASSCIYSPPPFQVPYYNYHDYGMIYQSNSSKPATAPNPNPPLPEEPQATPVKPPLPPE